MKNEQFEKDIEDVPAKFSGLIIVEEGGEKYLKGELSIVDASDKEWAKYQIEIKGSDRYPFSFPILFETAGAFPHNADWHVYEDNFSCCIDYPTNAIILCKNGLPVSDYIKNFAIPYFANQTFRIVEGYYRYGEYSHGIFGKIEYYQSKLKAKNPQELLEMLHLILNNYNPKRTSFCPFCRKVKFRHCHKEAFRDLQNAKDYVFQDREQLLAFFISNPDYNLPA